MCRREGQLFLNLRACSLNETSGAKLSVYYFIFLSSYSKEEQFFFFFPCVPGKQLPTIIHIRASISQLIKEISDILNAGAIFQAFEGKEDGKFENFGRD